MPAGIKPSTGASRPVAGTGPCGKLPARTVDLPGRPFLAVEVRLQGHPLVASSSRSHAGITSPCEQSTALVPASSRTRSRVALPPSPSARAGCSTIPRPVVVGEGLDGLDAAQVGARENRLDPRGWPERLGQSGGLSGVPCSRAAGGGPRPSNSAVAGGAVADEVKSAGGDEGVEIDPFENLARSWS